MAKQYWLMKSEPDQFGITDLERVRVEPWSGVRNYMARMNMRAMQVGDEVLFHHSNVDPPGVAGLARVVRTGVVDETQFDPASKYHDPKATREKPIWDCVDVEYVATFPYFVSLDRMRADPALADMVVLKRGMRLSVQPATEGEYQRIVALGHEPPPPELVVVPRQRREAARAAKPAPRTPPAGATRKARVKSPAKAARRPRAKAKPTAAARPAAKTKPTAPARPRVKARR
jgi:predicted RNA-binding protein with PUA-like domain